MSGIRVFLFGSVDVWIGENRILKFPTKKSRSLFAYLALSRNRTFSRLFVATQFWPESDEAHALRSLNTELWRLRATLKSAGADPYEFLRIDHDSIGFRHDCEHWIDAAEFDALTQGVMDGSNEAALRESTPALRQAITLYRGELAEGLFDEWCGAPREAYRTRFAAVLEFLMQRSVDARQWHDAITLGRRLLQLDPLLEQVHRAIIKCHLNLGNRAAALKQYAECAAILHAELRVEPMEETRQLITSLARPRATSPVEPAVPPPPSARDTPRAQPLEVALASLATARALLEQVITQLEHRETQHASRPIGTSSAAR